MKDHTERNVKFTGFLASVSLGSFLFVLAPGAWGAVKVESIDFKNGADGAVVEIRSDAPVQFTQQENESDNQVVIELSGVELAPGASRPLDTSSFESPVKLISPFLVEGQSEKARVVIQAQEKVVASTSQEGNVLRIQLSASGGAPAPDAVPSAQTAQAPESETPAPKPALNKDAEPANPQADKLAEFLKTQETQRFVGKPITIQLRDAELIDVFRLIGETSGFNIVLGDDVKGKITLSLANVPWDQALDMVLRTNKLGAERNNNVLRIASLQNLVQEKNQQLQAKQAAEANAPRVTRIFPISYANIGELQKLLLSFASTAQNGGTSAVVQGDVRTNSIIVRDTVENIEKMKSLIEIMDTQTPQVLIEARIVEASERFTRDLGGSLGGGSSSILWGATFNGGGIDALAGSAFTSTQGASLLGTSLDLSIIPGFSRLNAFLNLGETESKLKTVSAPRTVVLNKQTSTVTQVQGVVVPLVNNVQGSGSVSTFNQLNANISLTVTPTVTNDGSVLMDLTVARDITDVDSATKISMVLPRTIKTQVLVESGSTLSIGGVYIKSKQETGNGFPLLRKIPVLGWLFGSEGKVESNSELFFFITPRILNPREAGINPMGGAAT